MSEIEERRQRAKEAGHPGRVGPEPAAMDRDGLDAYHRIDLDAAIESATRVRLSPEIVDSGEQASGHGGDISRDTYRSIITAAFRAAGFEVEE